MKNERNLEGLISLYFFHNRKFNRSVDPFDAFISMILLFTKGQWILNCLFIEITTNFNYIWTTFFHLFIFTGDMKWIDNMFMTCDLIQHLHTQKVMGRVRKALYRFWILQLLNSSMGREILFLFLSLWFCGCLTKEREVS